MTIMKVHTTIYTDTFIEVAEDSTATASVVPPLKGDKKTAANMQFELISRNPYQYTSDDVLFRIFAEKKDLTEDELEAARKEFFSKGQACLRASPLPKTYGWGIHHNHEGKIALYGLETETYEKLQNDGTVKCVKAMRSSKG
jgi:hypothetical protein